MDGALTRGGYLSATAAAVSEIAGLFRVGPLAAPVPTCPGWDLGDLAGHLGSVQRWALASLASSTPPAEEAPPARDEVVDWFESGARVLLDGLAGADPEQPCWGFGPKPRTAGFWIRRQAHEATLHLWDAGNAVGSPTFLDPELAADGIDEVARMFYPRQVRLGRRAPLTAAVHWHCTDVERSGQLGDGAPVATVSGPAELLLLGLWHRVDLGGAVDDGRVTVEGDAAAARAILAEQLTP